MAKYTVSLRGGFSDRNNIKVENKALQTDAFDARTKTALINITDYIIQSYYPKIDVSTYNPSAHYREQLWLKSVMADVYSQVVVWSSSIHYADTLSAIKSTISTDSYDAVLTVIEYIANSLEADCHHRVFYKGTNYTAQQLYNHIFEQEYVGYRFLHGRIVPITDEIETSTIEDAVVVQHKAVQEHIDKALCLMADRENPDYANSIKESISAVERMCSIILGKATTLGDALKHLEDSGVKIHPALKAAFGKLYGYTSDASGIRHAGELGGKDSTFEEAKFMLVSCCAFVNYLTGVMAMRA